jgi:pyruvate/2-oxoglutarate dehydrogenase complex dihydrolipoamide dehydrogenase (E3) component
MTQGSLADPLCKERNPALTIEQGRNVIELLYDHGSRRILSCLAIGPDSTEIVNQACFCLSTNTPMESFLNISTIHPSPTEYMVRALRRRFDHNIYPSSLFCRTTF